jgi:L-seryl-tRNA(Ser) seleniumtransferase
MRENPLSRVLRVDKLTYAGLEATLLEYVRGTALSALPVPRMIAMTREAIDGRARRLCEALQAGAPGRIDIALLPGWSVLGGGSAPDERLPTTLLALRSGGLSARTIENRLRGFDPPIIARIEGKRVLLDLRTVPEREDDLLARAIASLDADETVRR